MTATISLSGGDAGERFAIDNYQLATAESGTLLIIWAIWKKKDCSLSAPQRRVKPTEHTYIRLEQECLRLDSLVNLTYYRIRDEHLVKLPVGSNNDFGVDVEGLDVILEASPVMQRPLRLPT